MSSTGLLRYGESVDASKLKLIEGVAAGCGSESMNVSMRKLIEGCSMDAANARRGEKCERL